MADEVTTRDVTKDALEKRVDDYVAEQEIKIDLYNLEGFHDVICRVVRGFAEAELARTTDLARLLEAMRRDAVDAECTATVLRIRVRTGGSGYVMLDGGAPTHFDTIEAGVAQLKAIIDDAEER